MEAFTVNELPGPLECIVGCLALQDNGVGCHLEGDHDINKDKEEDWNDEKDHHQHKGRNTTALLRNAVDSKQ